MRRRFFASSAAGVAILLFTSACSGGDKGGGVTVGGKDDAQAPQVTITPGDGTGKARPDKGVAVKATNGTLQQVTVTAGGKQIAGQLSGDRAGWQSRSLRPGTAYEVAVVAKNDKGKTTTATSRFKTLKAKNPLTIMSVTPNQGQKVGIGMPIQVTFNRPVADRRAVERALTVKSAKPATGAWNWISGNQVIFRTKNKQYWQPNQNVTLTAKLAGVRAAKDTYGVTDFTRRFRIGDAHIITVNTKTHRLVVTKNGKKVNGWGISAGKGGRVVNGVDTFRTTSGVHLTMGKENPAIMTSEWMGVDPKDKKNGGYREVIPFAVRISNTGEYLHAMAATVWAQGRQNVSHGCVNMPPAKAKWFYNWSYLGDVVIITGSGRGLDWNNGWSFYQMSWSRWVRGSALDQPVTTG